MRLRAMALCACLLLPAFAAAPAPSARAAQGQAVASPDAQPDGLTRLVDALQYVITEGDSTGLRALARPGINRVRLSEFTLAMTLPKVSAFSLKERDRAALVGGGARLLLEILTVAGGEGRVWTWRLDAVPGAPGEAWQIADVERLTVITGLFRLSLDPTVEWQVEDAVITAPDLTVRLASGYAFGAQVPGGTTALVFVGRGQIEFAPPAESERTQLRIFCRDEALRTGVRTVFLRLPPSEFAAHVGGGALRRRPVDAAHLRRAAEIFDEQARNSFQVDLNDLSRSDWSLVPSSGDFVAEIGTRKYGTLTYARAISEPEDVSFFDRRRRRNISVYTSASQLAARGRFFSENDRLDYDVTHYDVDTFFDPDRLWLDGTTTLTLHARDTLNGALTLRIAEPLVVRNVVSPEFGRLLTLRVVGQNNVLVGLPGTIAPGTTFRLAVTYSGRLAPQSIDREALTLSQEPQQEIVIPPEGQWMYSNRSYWYPQATVTDYATARISLTVPNDYDAIATGAPAGEPLTVTDAEQHTRKRFGFTASKPVRYLSFVVSRFRAAPPAELTLDDDAAPLTLRVEANPRQAGRMRQFGDKTSEILSFYAALVGDAPYESFTLALTEGELPGGHSPGYFALVTQPLPTTPFVWNNDPVAFPNYPSFFLAHEIAHQWWGQAIGGKNYHEQWLSEGFAQYFAAMFAARERGPDTFGSVIRQMRRWAMAMSNQGPVYLGYRLGHIRSDSRVFRALVYNKGAMVLHMLRRLVGDEAFFAGLRDFYTQWRFRKAGTDDFRLVMERAAGGRSLARFFERWIYESGTPRLHFSSHVQGSTLTVRFEQKTAALYDVPVTVTVEYDDGTTTSLVVTIDDKITEARIPVAKPVKRVDANKDAAALADVER